MTADTETEMVSWTIATDPQFQSIVGEGEVTASGERGHSVKVIADGLEPATTYYYRFALGDATSRVGRTKTLPTGEVEQFGIALASCSNYAFGYFNAYDAIAKDEAIDLVVHTGDYIYEYGDGEWGDDVGEKIGRPHDPPHEIVTLGDYRRRHAQYKSDAGSKAMHAAHPFVAFWDDHETTNNPWKGGAGNHEPEDEGEWTARRDASMQAYFEWMPIRDPAPGQPLYEYWRRYTIGDLATLITLETRHTGRDAQPAYPDFDSFKTAEDRERYVADELGNPDRRMLSATVEEHIRTSLAASIEQGQTWRLIGSASPLARFMLPDFVAAGIPEDAFPPDAEYMIPNGKWNLPWYSDTWDGYPVAREAFYQLARDAGAQDLLVLTGDTHNFFANELYNDAGEPVGVEIGATGIGSPGEFRDAGFPPELVERIDAIFAEGMDEVRWTESIHNGYVRIMLTHDAADVTYVGVDTVLIPDYNLVEVHRERIVKSGATLAYS
ncbi:MAG: alkaline phosphatase D family protein [Pseudomonadota bacterium]